MSPLGEMEHLRAVLMPKKEQQQERMFRAGLHNH